MTEHSVTLSGCVLLQAHSEADPDTELLREQMRVMADELGKREALIEAIRSDDGAAFAEPNEDQGGRAAGERHC